MIKLKIEYKEVDSVNEGTINAIVSDKVYSQIHQLVLNQKSHVVKTYYARFMNNRTAQLNWNAYIKGKVYGRHFDRISMSLR